MMQVTIHPRPLTGTVTPPCSKSQAHRLIICAALACGDSTLGNVILSQDIQATLDCMAALGARWQMDGEDALRITGIGERPLPIGGVSPDFACGESGSTLRFLIPVALAVAGGGSFTGRGRLMQRPQQPYFDLFDQRGIAYRQTDDTLTVRGELKSGEYALPGDVSSQFLTGLLLALPLLQGDSRIRLTSALESRDYVTMTLHALERFGVSARQEGDCFVVPGGQRYRGVQTTVEADWSQAAFWYAANFLGSEIKLEALNPRSAQGDIRVADWYWKLARPGDVELDVSQCPDLLPPVAAMAAMRRGTCRLVNAARLRLKESDRLTAVAQALSRMGAQISEGADSLTICGIGGLEGGVAVECHNDHRIAMMAAVAAIRCRRPVTLLGAQCVEKSYPRFWEEYRRLGGELDVVISG